MVEYLYKDEFRTILREVENNPEAYLKEAQALGQLEEVTDIGIGTDGNIVNLSYWNYWVRYDNIIAIGGGSQNGAYTGPIQDGKIVGTVPQYIYSEGKIFVVTEMEWVFTNNTELKIAPKLPDTVERLDRVFIGATSLETPCEIPSSVTSVRGIFQECTNLTGTITINSDVLEDYHEFLYNVGSEERPIVLKGTGNNLEILEAIRLTGNSEYITIEQ